MDFLRAHLDTQLLLPSVALGEYLEGFEDPAGPAAQALVSPLKILAIGTVEAELYARVTRALRARRSLIGTNDLWIACAALAARAPIVTRNVEHFGRIPGLDVVDYTR
jgi:predicted nucleic acid-binding protein